MAKRELQKLKLLFMYEYLWKYSAEDDPKTTGEILAYMSEKLEGNYTRETLLSDINALNAHGYEVCKTKVSRQKAYYIPEREFENGELRMLIDAVQAANFISRERTSVLVGKIAKLNGPCQEKHLCKNMVFFNTRKHNTKSIFSTIETLSQAIESNHRISFRLFRRDENHEKKYSNNGNRYVVDPITLVYDHDFYYLLTYDTDTQKNYKKYRIDRTEGAAVEEAFACSAAIEERSNVAEYKRRVIDMFDGETRIITINFQDYITDYIYDKFGEDTNVTRVDKEYCSASVEVDVSPPFWGWIFQFSDDIQVLNPKSMNEAYSEILMRTLENLRNTLCQ